MRNLLLTAGAVLALAAGGAAHAATVADPTGDFLASYTGNHDADLDVTSFGVAWDAGAAQFLVHATMAGPIDPGKPGIYVLGIDTGAGALHPFGPIGEAKVRFDQAAIIQKSGATALGAHGLTATISGASFDLAIPLAFLPSTGFAPSGYLFNLWPRNGAAGLGSISDFAPQNALLSAVPEPAEWALMLAGFGLIGLTLRRPRRPKSSAA